jgi:membrane associated rhomboid family serine protease
MIPLRDDVPSRSIPYVKYALLGLNVAVFVYELSLGHKVAALFQQAAVIPALFTGPDGTLSGWRILARTTDPSLAARVVASMFLHGGFLHVIGNMLYLWIFGDNVEDRMGHGRYLAFYVVCGWTATFAHVWSQAGSQVPSVGASGAIGGVLGAYMILYPKARVVTLLPLGFFTQIVRVPALVLLAFWFLQQFLAGALSLSARSAETGGVAWWAHIGGFAAGVALVGLFQRPRRRPRSREARWRGRRAGGRTVRRA